MVAGPFAALAIKYLSAEYIVGNDALVLLILVLRVCAWHVLQITGFFPPTLPLWSLAALFPFISCAPLVLPSCSILLAHVFDISQRVARNNPSHVLGHPPLLPLELQRCTRLLCHHWLVVVRVDLA